MAHSKFRLLAAVIVGMIVGSLAAEAACNIMLQSDALLSLGLAMLLVGFSVSSVVVCLMVRSHYIFVGMVPTVAGILWLRFQGYLQLRYVEGVTLKEFLLMKPDAGVLVSATAYVLAALAVSVFMRWWRTSRSAGHRD